MASRKDELKAKEKEKTDKLKTLRREMETELEEQLAVTEATRDERIEVEKINIDEPLDSGKAQAIIEALLFAASKPFSIAEMRKVLRGMTPKQIEESVNELRALYDAQGRSFQIVEIAGGYEIVTRKQYAPWILKVELQKKARQATQSALETLAILAYKQPVTRAEIEDLRGVDASGVMTTLMERGLIKIVGRKEVPGRPFLYGTTEKFLEHFGLSSIKSLPSIDEIKTVVENSVNKEELLGQSRMVDAPVEGETVEAAQETASAEESEPAAEAPSESAPQEGNSQEAVS